MPYNKLTCGLGFIIKTEDNQTEVTKESPDRMERLAVERMTLSIARVEPTTSRMHAARLDIKTRKHSAIIILITAITSDVTQWIKAVREQNKQKKQLDQ